MTRQEIKTALKCCISHGGQRMCEQCPYHYLRLNRTPFVCTQRLYNDIIKLLGNDELISVDLDKAIQDGK